MPSQQRGRAAGPVQCLQIMWRDLGQVFQVNRNRATLTNRGDQGPRLSVPFSFALGFALGFAHAGKIIIKEQGRRAQDNQGKGAGRRAQDILSTNKGRRAQNIDPTSLNTCPWTTEHPPSAKAAPFSPPNKSTSRVEDLFTKKKLAPPREQYAICHAI